MKYIGANGAAKKWGITDRRVTLLCNQGRVEGAYRMGGTWAIPENAPKPVDPRRDKNKQNRLETAKNESIKTKRLLLIPVNMTHVQDIFDNFTTEITTYMYPKPAENIDETKSVVETFIKQRENKTDFVYAITKDDKFIGLAGIHKLNDPVPELGVWTKKNAHGNKFGREAVTAIVKFMRKIKFDSFIYPVDKRNVASCKIAESLGGVIKGKRTGKGMAGNELQIVEYWI